ncbi:unnamed protein product [Rhizophagus irregularis]|uniref:Uncharacterized protein n=1 Tax=Rhizophagus irregularis TaxID=588596 RepID=A0A916DYD5_9GLOM|nr:unnamed protein product [Rhizophagus irregularis]CAB4476024.1 unnamed protein product [Rhizophagus irregularis]CAB5207841.1 unnamed protein product [Rhizophagus irregularis]CAB5291863.1 unnamed protein product [Rhizophagus irregularis]CAB5379451.1 unnamed protein product [Rhizophagus irregularis]
MIVKYSFNQSNSKRDLNESDRFSKKDKLTFRTYIQIRNSSSQQYNEESSLSDSEIIPILLTNVFSEV